MGASSVHAADFDGDGDMDIVAAGTAGKPLWYENSGPGGGPACAEACGAAGACQAGAAPSADSTCDETGDACVGGAEAWLSFNDAASMPGLDTVQNEDIAARNLPSGL